MLEHCLAIKLRAVGNAGGSGTREWGAWKGDTGDLGFICRGYRFLDFVVQFKLEGFSG